MNRYNFGNVATNAMQIGSTGVFTATRSLGNAASALNNLSPQERKDYGEMQANMIRDEMANYNRLSAEQRDIVGQAKAQKSVDKAESYMAKGESPMQHLSTEEQAAFQNKKANRIRDYINESDNINVDEIMGDFLPNTEQGEEVLNFVKNNFDWVQKRNKGRFTKEFEPVWKKKEDNSDADV